MAFAVSESKTRSPSAAFVGSSTTKAFRAGDRLDARSLFRVGAGWNLCTRECGHSGRQNLALRLTIKRRLATDLRTESADTDWKFQSPDREDSFGGKKSHRGRRSAVVSGCAEKYDLPVDHPATLRVLRCWKRR